MQDLSKVSQSKYLEYLDLIEPLYKEYNKQKNRIDYRRKQFNELKKWERDDETRKAISADYAKLKADYKAKCEEICPYPSILASVAVEIAYFKYGTYGFAWLFVEGLLENLKKHENVVKKEVLRVNRLTNRSVEGKELVIRDGTVSIDDLKFEFNAPDGVYPLFEIMGQFYIWYEADRETIVETSDTPALMDGSSTRRTLREQYLRFGSMKKTIEETQQVASEMKSKPWIIKNIDHRFINIVDEHGVTKCYVTRDHIVNTKEKISLFDFDGAVITFIEVEKVSKSSFGAIVSIE